MRNRQTIIAAAFGAALAAGLSYCDSVDGTNRTSAIEVKSPGEEDNL